MLLPLTTDKIQVVTGQAVTVDVHASFLDMTNGDPPSAKGSTTGKQNTAISTAATTDVVAAPAASTVRNIKYINIRNRSAGSTVDVTVLYNANGTTFELHKVTLQAQQVLMWTMQTGWLTVTPTTATTLMKILSADDAGGQNVATAQPWFPTAGGVTVAGDTTYKMEGSLRLIRAAGAVSHTTGLLFAGTATLTSIEYVAYVNSGDVETNLAGNRTVSRVATNTTVKGASTSTTEAINIEIVGTVRINAAGTFIPQFIYSAAPGGAPTIKANSRFILTPVGSGSFTAQGTWA